MAQMNEWLEEIKHKMQFVNLKLKPMMVALHTGVTDVEYRAFKNKDDTDGEEFLIVTYAGGATDVTCCSANSDVAIAEEAIELATYKGHYGHRQRLERVESKPDEWIKLPNFAGFEYDERSYLAWVLIYDQMISLSTLPENPDPEDNKTIVLNAPCDVGYEICLKIADDFLKSDANDPSKPLYSAFGDWFWLQHFEEISCFIKNENKHNPA